MAALANANFATPSGTKKQATLQTCMLCGKPSGETICHACADKVQGEAVNKKKREYKGTA